MRLIGYHSRLHAWRVKRRLRKLGHYPPKRRTLDGPRSGKA